MGTTQSWETPLSVARADQALGPCDRGTGKEPDGFLEQSRRFLLGTESSAWLDRNSKKAFATVDNGLQQLTEAQAMIQTMLDDAKQGILPEVTHHGPDGPESVPMDQMQFLLKLAELASSTASTMERVLNARNKVATGGTNILTAALMGSNALQFAAQRKERAVGIKRKVGVDAIPEGVIDV